MNEKIAKLVEKYRSKGTMKAGALLLKPDDALLLVDELEGAGVLIQGVDVWNLTDGNIARESSRLDLTTAAGGSTKASENAFRAKRYIAASLPQKAAFVSFVLKP